MRQTYKKLEVIIIYDDEEQTDLNFINSLIKNKRNIKLIINKKNFGAGKSRNIGIKKSNGKYLAFLDSDDYWKKDKIKTQLLYMKQRNIDFSHTDYIIIDRWKRRLGTMKVKKELNYDQLLKSCDIGLSTVMIKRSILIKNLFTGLKTKEDYCLWLKLAKKKLKLLD